jgi:hypothetical protein
VRALPQVKEATFDIASETFAITSHDAAAVGAILTVIEKLGFTPEVLEQEPTTGQGPQHLRSTTSDALRKGLATAAQRGAPL